MKAILDTSVLLATDVPELEGELAISAATAHAHGARLYTLNAADLVGIKHLIDIVAV